MKRSPLKAPKEGAGKSNLPAKLVREATKNPAISPDDVRVISSAIHKGGTGKTTISVHLAHYIAAEGHRVLMVDCDTQGNSTQVFLDDDYHGPGVSGLFTKKGRTIVPVETNTTNVLLIPADDGMVDIDGLNHGEEYLFRDNLRAVAAAAGCRYVVIDTPPTLTMGMLAPLVASNFAFSPFKPDSFGVKGIVSLHRRIEQIRVNHNPSLRYLGLLINLWNRRNADQNNVVAYLEQDLGEHLIEHKIGDRAAIARVAFSRIPVWAHNTGAARVASKEMRAAMGWIFTQMEHQS